MSKTIEVVAPSYGKFSVKVKGESRVIDFYRKERDGRVVGLALCDHDEAEVLLGNPALGFHKVGGEVSTNDPTASEKAADAGENSDNEGKSDKAKAAEIKEQAEALAAITNFNGFKSAVGKCDNLEALKAVIAAEVAKEEPKDNRLAILNERIAALQG